MKDDERKKGRVRHGKTGKIKKSKDPRALLPQAKSWMLKEFIPAVAACGVCSGQRDSNVANDWLLHWEVSMRARSIYYNTILKGYSAYENHILYTILLLILLFTIHSHVWFNHIWSCFFSMPVCQHPLCLFLPTMETKNGKKRQEAIEDAPVVYGRRSGLVWKRFWTRENEMRKGQSYSSKPTKNSDRTSWGVRAFERERGRGCVLCLKVVAKAWGLPALGKKRPPLRLTLASLLFLPSFWWPGRERIVARPSRLLSGVYIGNWSVICEKMCQTIPAKEKQDTQTYTCRFPWHPNTMQ